VKWSEYAAAAGPSDRWYGLAEAHKAQCENALRRKRRVTPRR
jgi:hypothetical protein